MTIDSLQRDSQSRISILGSLRYCNYKNKFSISWLSKYANWGRGGYKATVETLSLRRVYSIYSIYISGSPTANNLYMYVRACGIQILSIFTYLLMCIVLPRVVCPCLHLPHCHLLPPLQLTQVLRVRGELKFNNF